MGSQRVRHDRTLATLKVMGVGGEAFEISDLPDEVPESVLCLPPSEDMETEPVPKRGPRQNPAVPSP